jgi:hypothetical protein
MSDHDDARRMLDRAERAATAGDFASADELLTGAAKLQEKELGPHHPDLANTLNNLAIVAERAGRPAEAETLYRRAASIAAAAFPPDHPMVVASTQNLEDFCRARGLPIKLPAATPPPPRADPAVSAAAPEYPPAAANTPAVERPVETAVSAPPAPSAPAAPSHDPRPPMATTSQPSPPAPTPGRASHSFAWIATGVIVFAAAVLLMLRPGSSRDPSTSAPAQTPAPEAASAPPAEAVPPLSGAPPVSRAPVRPAPAPRPNEKSGASNRPSGAGPVTLATAQLCSTFSTSGGAWRCTPVGTSVKPGPIVFYTRVRSARNAAVVHRWYRGRTLRQSVKLATRASAREGYRTYSRQTVSQGDWTVEARTADGALLHEQTFAVR